MSNRQSMVFATVLLLALVGIGAGIWVGLSSSPLGAPVVSQPVGAGTTVASSVPALPVPPPEPPNMGLVIKKAVYGDLPDGTSLDVTAIVMDHIKEGRLSIAASNDLFTDTAPGIVKKLHIAYLYSNARGYVTVAEGETATLPPRLMITRAEYGDLPNGAKNIVTQRVAEKVKDDALKVAATDENFDDPTAGVNKQLRVEFTFDGRAKAKTVNEDETLTITNTGD